MSRTGARLLLGLAVAAAIVAFFWFDLHAQLSLESLRARQASLQATVQAHPWAAAAAYVAAYVAMAALSLPGAAILTLAGGALFGLWTGTLLVSFASSIGATLAFLAARFLFRDAVQRRFGERLSAVDRGVARDGAFYLLSLRLVPAFPFFVVNLVMALTPLRTWTFYWVSQLGMLPATIVYVNAGTELAQLRSAGDILSPGLLGAFLLLAAMPLALRAVLGWLRRRRAWRGFSRPRRFDYNLLVIGAGSGGLVTAYIAAATRARVALVEKHRMGGDCLNTGCVPSKALIRTATLLAEARDAPRYGVRRLDAQADFGEVMERVQRVVAAVAPHDSVERYTALGVDCIAGEARLCSPWQVQVGGRTLSARHIVIATGARPTVPKLPGLDAITFLTSDTVWSLREAPERLLVLGGGPIGCELAQAFRRVGIAVTLVQRNARLLPKEDPDASQWVAERLAADGVQLLLGHSAKRIEEGSGAAGVLVCAHADGERRVPFDRLLLALGRTPNTEGLGLEALGIACRADGTIATDERLRTAVPNILACGDITGPHQFTHAASYQAWVAAVNALASPFWSWRSQPVLPWCTFTQPEVARVGLSESEAAERDIAVEVTRYNLDDLDRAIADGDTDGFVKVLTVPGKDRILGATIVGRHAGEMIATFTLAMKHGLGLEDILATVHAYPTHMEANKAVAGAWKRQHAPQRLLRLAERLHRWRRG